ncbi:hemogen isoform X1 [Grus americana]|uniref:hemogen isoform X1 n=1 Tax=Grus americana TaxID=9117 RepID=UPI0024081B43|nr:hemogen isoform X1 [Grus americana]
MTKRVWPLASVLCHQAGRDETAPWPRCHVSTQFVLLDVIITRRLRDRELLRKRKAEAEEKDSIQWVLREQERSKRQRRGRGARRGRGRQQLVEPTLESGPGPESQPGPQEEAEPAPPEPAPPEPVHQEQLPVLTIQDVVSEMQPDEMEGELAAMDLTAVELADSIQDPIGEVELLKPAEAEIPEALNAALESEEQDNDFNTHVLF